MPHACRHMYKRNEWYLSKTPDAPHSIIIYQVKGDPDRKDV